MSIRSKTVRPPGTAVTKRQPGSKHLPLVPKASDTTLAAQITLEPLHDRKKRDAIFEAASTLDIVQTDAWSDLDLLSNRTHVDSLDVVPEAIFETEAGGFAAAATVYVQLQYGDKNDSIASSDAFPAQVYGHFEDANAVIDTLNVDTSSFYD